MNIKRLLIYSFVILFLGITLRLVMPSFLSGLSSPMGSIRRASNLVLGLLHYPRIYKEYQRLLAKDREISFYENYNQSLKEENKRLRAMLNMPPTAGFDYIFADVIASPLSGKGDFFYIDAGKDKGVRVGMGVILSGYVVAGRVVEVRKHISKVSFLWNVNFSCAAMDEFSKEEGVVVGGRPVRLRFLSQKSHVEVGDVVRTSVLSLFFPPGSLIGEIVGFKCKPGQVECFAEIRPCIEGMSIYQVIVLSPRRDTGLLE